MDQRVIRRLEKELLKAIADVIVVASDFGVCRCCRRTGHWR